MTRDGATEDECGIYFAQLSFPYSLSPPRTAPPRLAGGKDGATSWTKLLGKFQISAGAPRCVRVPALGPPLTPTDRGGRARRETAEPPPHLTCPSENKPRTAGDQRVSAPPLSRLPRRYADSLPRIPTATSQTLTQRLAAAGWRSGDSPAPCRPPQPLSRPLASAAGPGPPFASLTAVSSGAGGGNTKMPQTKGSNKEA